MKEETTTIANLITKLPKGYTLFTGKDRYRVGDCLEIEKNKTWSKLSESSILVKRKFQILKEVSVYRKNDDNK